MITVYCARPMTGFNMEELTEYYKNIRETLEPFGIRVFAPLSSAEKLLEREVQKASGYKHPLLTDHAIVARDKWMIGECNIFLADWAPAVRPSLGMVVELTVANERRLHTISVLPEGNVHQHAFIIAQSDVIVYHLEDSLCYLVDLATKKSRI